MPSQQRSQCRGLCLKLSRLWIGLVLLMPVMSCASAQGTTYRVGADLEYKALSQVVPKLKSGDTVTIAAGEYFDCAVIRTNNVTIEGLGPNGTSVITDKACEGKGLLVISGAHVTIRNLTLTRARVADMNGAGIRDESPELIVEHVKFINNQNGILSGTPPGTGVLIVRDSEFDKNGTCEASCAHGIYAGNLQLLHVERSKFSDTRQAHHIKSRALRTEVIDSTISDGADGTASYEIEIPNGGSVVIRGNNIQKGPKAENHTAAIMIGAEGVTQPSREILVENNVFRNTGDYDTYFVDNLTATEAVLKNNKLSGRAKPLKGDGSSQ
jgi:hypothetical protein